MKPNDYDIIKNYLQQFEGVVDIGYGLKEVNGINTQEISIIVNVLEKKNIDNISPSELIPAQIYGIPIDVVSIKRIEDETDDLVQPNTDRYTLQNPLVAGINIRNEKKRKGIGGTLGAFVRMSSDNNIYAITNRHVVNRKIFGCIGDPIVQPYNVRTLDGRIGIVRLVNQKLDIAFIEITNRPIADGDKFLGITGGLTKVISPEINMKVFKSGARTGITYGVITKIWPTSARVEPDMEVYGDNDVEISKGGDSGSIWMNYDAGGNFCGVLLHNLGEKDTIQNLEWSSGIRLDVIQKVYNFSFL